MNHVLIDIEGMGKKPGCTIFELAAVQFDITTGQTGAEFLALIEPDNGYNDPETEEWHRQNGTYPTPGSAERIGIAKALRDFVAWYGTLGEIESVWSWGSTYDFPVLDSRWRDWGPTEEPPWEYYQVECARGMWRRAFGKDVRHDPRPHRALEDCKAAIADLRKALGRFVISDSPGVALIAAERARQVAQEGWLPDHDDTHTLGELASASACYLIAGDCLANASEMGFAPTAEGLRRELLDGKFREIGWPWGEESLKIDADPIRNYTKAGTLIAAEADRLERLKGKAA